MDGAANRASFAVFPVSAVNDFIGFGMRAYSLKVLRLDLRIVVKS
jgi:hypothetical protein